MPEKGHLRGQVPDCPDFTRVNNKPPSGDEYLMPRHNTFFSNIYVRTIILYDVNDMHLIKHA